MQRLFTSPQMLLVERLSLRLLQSCLHMQSAKSFSTARAGAQSHSHNQAGPSALKMQHTSNKKEENRRCQSLLLWPFRCQKKGREKSQTSNFFGRPFFPVSILIDTIAEPLSVTYWHRTTSCPYEKGKVAKLSTSQGKSAQHPSRICSHYDLISLAMKA